MSLKTAVIGIGNMGKNHVRTYYELKKSNLVGISDINESLGRKLSEKYNCNYYKDYKKMIKIEKPDIISVCVPTSLHYKVARDVINSNVNVLIEKPISQELEEAKELILLAKKNEIKLTVGHIERFNPAVQKLKKIIDSGKLGNITSILARRVGLFPPQIKDANVITDLAVHDIDIFSYLLCKSPKSIHAGIGKALINEREDYADIFLKYNGVNGFIEVNWITPVKIRVLNITGTKGYARLNYITQELVLYKSKYKKTYDKFGDFVLEFGEAKKNIIKVKKEEPLKLELKHFIDCVKNNKEPLVTGTNGLEVLKIAKNIIINYKEEK